MTYQRDYKRERALQIKRGENKDDATRHKARREAIKLGMVKTNDGKDIDHIKPLSKGGAGLDPKNLRAESEHANRSYARTSKGAIKKP